MSGTIRSLTPVRTELQSVNENNHSNFAINEAYVLLFMKLVSFEHKTLYIEKLPQKNNNKQTK